jgi:hypothetical protein
MYLRGSKWNMRRRQPKINWFLVILVVILIAVVTYVDRFILPTAQTPFMPTPTDTRDPESYVTALRRRTRLSISPWRASRFLMGSMLMLW